MDWLDKKPRFPRFGGLTVRESDCSYIWKVPAELRCEWVQITEDCYVDSYITYPTILFCSFESQNPFSFGLGVLLLFLWLLYLFLVLGTTADNFFCPSLSTIASVMKLSENIAGVTILAFGNGSPDIFTSLVSSEDERMIMFTELIGAGVFVTAIIAGSVVVAAPFRVQLKYFIRDVCFYIVAVCWISLITQDEIVQLWEAFSCIGIYILFIVTAVLMQKVETRQEKRKKRIPRLQDAEVLRVFVENYRADVDAPPQLPKRSRAFDVQAKLDVAISRENARAKSTAGGQNTRSQSQSNGPIRPKGLFREFLYDVSPVNLEEWRRARIPVKLLLLIRSPFMLLLQLCVPVVNETAEKRGWSKLLNCFQIWFTPILAIYLLDLSYVKFGPVSLLYICIACTSTIAFLMLMLTAVDRIPKYHNALAFIGFLVAMLVVYMVAQEVMAVLQCFGYASGISDPMLGITLLAWGNSVGDLISNVTIARKGYPRMGFAACFGGPMFNTLLGLGLSYGISALNSPSFETRIRTSDMAPGCLAFLLSSLLSSLIYLGLTGFLARPSLGYLLFSVYAAFLLINLLSELHLIHPLGTDHRPDDS